MTPAPDKAMPCHIAELESNIGYYDMPEAEPELMVSGWALVELIDEVKRWRETHKAGEFSPDYCAAREALAEQLEELSKNGRPMAAIRIGQAISDLTAPSPVEVTEEQREILSHALYVAIPRVSHNHILLILDGMKALGYTIIKRT